jgi:hypothetical protein
MSEALELIQRNRHESVRGSSDRAFGFVFAVFFAILGGLKFTHNQQTFWWYFLASGAFAGASVVWPVSLRPLNIAWARFGNLLQVVTSPIILFVLYFFIFVPAGLLMRAFRHDPMKRKWEPSRETYWEIREPRSRDQMKNQF